MNKTLAGLICGLLVAISTCIAGMSGFFLAVVFGIIGAVIAGQLTGELDVRRVGELFDNSGRG